MKLNLGGSKLLDLKMALLGAFPAWHDLAPLAQYYLTEPLDSITAQQNQSIVIDGLIAWACKKGELAPLIGAAVLSNPRNDGLRGFFETLSSETRLAYPLNNVLFRQADGGEVNRLSVALAHKSCIGTDSPPLALLLALPAKISLTLAESYSTERRLGVNWPQLLAKTCARFVDCYRILISAIEELAPDSGMASFIEMEVLKFAPARFTEVSLTQLTKRAKQANVSNTAGTDILDYFAKNCDFTCHNIPGTEHNLVDQLPALIRHLANRPSHSHADHPLLKLVSYLAQADAQVATKLQEWTATHASSQIPEFSLQAPPSTVQRGYLVVVIKADDQQADRYSARAWAVPEGSHAVKIYDDGSTSHSFVALEKNLQNLRKQVADRNSLLLNDLQIEFFLPRQLLCANIENWRVRVGRRTSHLRSLHPLVLRSYERAYDPELRDVDANLRRKWELLHSGRPVKQDAIYWTSAEPPWDTDYSTSAEPPGDTGPFIEKLRREPVLCLALESLPPESPTLPANDAIDASFEAGIPALVWVSNVDLAQAPAVLAALKSALTPEVLPELPAWAYRQRTAPAPPPATPQLQPYLKVLWDPPDRPPPDVGILRQAVARRSET